MPLQKNFQDIGIPSVVAPLNISVGEFIEGWLDVPGAGEKIPLSAIETLEKSSKKSESIAGQFLRLFKEKPAILKEYLTQNPKTLEELKKIRIKVPIMLGEVIKTLPKTPPAFIPKEIPAEIITPKEAKERGLIKEAQIRTLPKEIPAEVIMPKEAKERGMLKETQIRTLPKEIPADVILPKEAKERGLLKETQIKTLPKEISVTETKKEVPKPIKEVKPKEAAPKTKEKAALETIVDESIKKLIAEEEMYSNIIKTANEELKKSREKYSSKIDELSKNIKEWGDKLDTYYQKISEELEKPLPKPPTREEIVTPKQSLLAVLKDLTPLVVGLTALLRPGKYGENLFYFNSMYQAIRDSDDRKFKEALDNWQREMQIGIAEKNNKINALKTLADSIKGKIDILGTTGQLALKGIEVEISGWEDQIKNASTMIDKINKSISEIKTQLYREQRLLQEQEKIKIQRDKLELEREKAKMPKTEADKYIAGKEEIKGRPLTPKEKEDARKEYYQLRKFGFAIKTEELTPEMVEKFIKKELYGD